MSAGPASGRLEHRRVLPSERLSASIAHFWWVRWELGAPHEAETLPHPSAHLVFEQGDDRRELFGVSTRRFVRRLEGEGEVFGIKFRPAAFQPLLGASMAAITDRALPLERVFGEDAEGFRAEVGEARGLEAKIATAEAFLGPRVSPLPAEVAALRDLTERIAEDRALVRAEEVARLAGLDARTLQRRFRRFVGVGPKWVLRRFRLHEAAARLAGARPPPLAALAAELGYSDQAHFSRDFAATVGCSPGRFIARRRAR